MKQFIGVVAIILFALGMVGVIHLLKEEPQPVKVEKPIVTVDALEVYRQSVPIHIKTQGTVRPKKQTQLVSEGNGKVEYISSKFVVGAFVKKGETLIKISDTDYQIRLQSARSQVISAQSAVAQEQSLARVARQEWEWRERKALDAKAKEAALRVPQLKAAKAKLKAAQLEVDNAQEQLTKLTVRAPYDGIVRAKQVELGQFVSAGTPLGQMFSSASAEVLLSVPETKLQYLELPNIDGTGVKKPVKIYLDEATKDQRFWKARLERSEGTIDPQTHFLNVIAEIKDPYQLSSGNENPLRVGTFINADIDGVTFDNVIKLSENYIRAGSRVWVINDQMKLEDREVKVIFSQANTAYISQGLEEGEKVSTTALSANLAGSDVKINKLESQKGIMVEAKTATVAVEAASSPTVTVSEDSANSSEQSAE